jgi:hypothetical protein
MALDQVPESILRRYRLKEYRHASGVLQADFPEHWRDILACLEAFTLKRSWIDVGGGGRSSIPRTLDNFLAARGWKETRFDIKIVVDQEEHPTPTHKIDNFKPGPSTQLGAASGVGVEVEWNNKTEFYDRDLNNFRLLHELRVLSVGVIITRVSELQDVFDNLQIGQKYGASTTHWDKLIPKVEGGGAGGCPLLLVGITAGCYDETL